MVDGIDAVSHAADKRHAALCQADREIFRGAFAVIGNLARSYYAEAEFVISHFSFQVEHGGRGGDLKELSGVFFVGLGDEADPLFRELFPFRVGVYAFFPFGYLCGDLFLDSGGQKLPEISLPGIPERRKMRPQLSEADRAYLRQEIERIVILGVGY